MATQTDQIALVEDLRSTLESFFAGPDGIIKSIVPLTYIHFIMILSVGFMFILLVGIHIPWRLIEHRRLMVRIPRRYIPISAASLPAGMVRAIDKERIRELTTASEPVDEMESYGKFGFGRPGTNFANTHFKTSIRKSYERIQDVAKKRDMRHVLKPGTSVATYMEFLCDKYSRLDSELVSAYIGFYEKAAFSDSEFTESEYSTFTRVLKTILLSIDR